MTATELATDASAEGVDDTAQAKPSRPKLPPVPAHLRGLLTHSSAKQGSRASLQPLPAASVQTGPEPVPTSCLAPGDAKQPAAELHAAILQQAAKLKPTKRLHTPEMPAQAINQVRWVLKVTTFVSHRAA